MEPKTVQSLSDVNELLTNSDHVKEINNPDVQDAITKVFTRSSINEITNFLNDLSNIQMGDYFKAVNNRLHSFNEQNKPNTLLLHLIHNQLLPSVFNSLNQSKQSGLILHLAQHPLTEEELISVVLALDEGITQQFFKIRSNSIEDIFKTLDLFSSPSLTKHPFIQKRESEHYKKGEIAILTELKDRSQTVRFYHDPIFVNMLKNEEGNIKKRLREETNELFHQSLITKEANVQSAFINEKMSLITDSIRSV
ncbi:MAG: hypothetical protein PSV35_06965, partial [bacterium]|nr:hypothetical protein [bacterium]